jgi:uncharacterized protein YbjT (DUF2867 family)
VVAETLLARGAAVRVIVRDAAAGASWAARGAEVAVSSLDDVAGLTRAFTGVDGAYVLVPPIWGAAHPVEAARAVSTAIAEAAKAAKLAHVVLLSSIGAQHADGNGPIRILNDAEQRLAGLPGVTALRAAYFLENWASVLPVAKSDGVLPSFLAADLAVPTVAVADIGRVAAELLLAGPRGHQVVGLAGPADPTGTEVAAAVGRLLGRPVGLAAHPVAAAAGGLEAAGVPAPWAKLYAEMYAGISSGRVAFDGVRVVRGAVGVQDGLAPLLGA